MILPDWKLKELCEKRGLLTPYEVTNVNPASIDLTLDGAWIDLATKEEFVSDIIAIVPSRPILATTREVIKLPNNYAASVYLKSSMARQGLDHALAGWVDPGFCGQLTLEFHAHVPVTLRVGQRVCQIVLYEMAGTPDKPYGAVGRYQGQMGPTMAREYKGER